MTHTELAVEFWNKCSHLSKQEVIHELLTNNTRRLARLVELDGYQLTDEFLSKLEELAGIQR